MRSAVWLLVFVICASTVHATVTGITLSSPGNNTWTSDVTPDFTFTAVSDTNTTFTCELLVDSAGFGLNASTQNDTATTITANASLSEGVRNWQIDCTDVNGTVSSESRILNVDATLPTSTINTPANDTATADTTPEISFTLTDNLDGTLEYAVFVDGSANGQSGTSGNGTQTFLNLSALAEGTHTVIVQATDEAANAANSTPLTITVDTTDPTANITSPANGTSTTDTTPTISFNLTDNLASTINYTVFVDGTANVSGSGSNNTNTDATLTLSTGTFTILVQATDGAGNSANSSSIELTVSAAAAEEEEETSGRRSLPGLSLSGHSIVLGEGVGRHVFILGRDVHYMEVSRIDDEGVTLVFTSDPVEVTLRAGEERNVDVTGDGIVDVYVKLTSHTEKTAYLEVGKPKQISPPPAEETQSEPEPEGTPEPSGPETPAEETTPAQPETAPPEEDGGLSWVWAVAVIAALAAGGWWFFGRKP